MKTFDVVVLGGGTSGCVVVNRLVNAGLDVCLIEAGPDYGPFSRDNWPKEILDGKVAPVTTHDWGFHNTNRAGKDINDLRAKVMGGCSAHNHCGAVWPQPEDFGAWSGSSIDSGWTYKDILPLIDIIERVETPQTKYHGRRGLLPTRTMNEEDLTRSRLYFIKSAEACGFPLLQDMSSPLPVEGIGSIHCNVTWDYVRWNSAFAFLDPVRNFPNLSILAETLVDKIVFRESMAVEAVCISPNQGVLKVPARTFLLSAGVYGSPTILLRSGLGPKDDLNGQGIQAKANLPGVGKNLHDHPNISIRFKPTEFGKDLIKEETKTKTLATTILRAKSSQSDLSFDLHVIPRVINASPENETFFGTLVENMAPRSRENVTLRGKDPNLPPSVDFRFFTDKEDNDVRVLRDGIILARRLWDAEPQRSLVETEVLPGRDEPDLLTYIRNNNMTYHHPVGTCKMGSGDDPSDVVNYSGLVKTTENVFVADASIIPIIPRANTNLTCLLIGIKIANDLVSSRI